MKKAEGFGPWTKCGTCGDEHAPETARCERHSGWTNYETWGVAALVDNDAVLLAKLIHWARLPDEARGGMWFEDAIRNVVDGWHEDMFAKTKSEDCRRHVVLQLAQAALGRVNWRELADWYVAKAA